MSYETNPPNASDEIFKTLADPTRRAIFEHLMRDGGQNVRALTDRFDAGVEGGMTTLVTWTLTPTPDGVVLQMEQSGFRQQDEHNFHGAARGWQRFMANPEQVLASLAP
jgi:uncharacterized protein YndB with AHSA1/START domain